MNEPGEETAATNDAEGLAALMRAIQNLTPADPAAPSGASTWVERRRAAFDTLDPYGDA